MINARHLVEVGFMGAGKTTVGQAVASRFELPFYDTDERVVAVTGKPIPEIFANEGETEFRKYERDALLAVLEEEPGIVSTGGGIVTTQLGREALIGCGAPVVWLRLDFDTTKARVEADITVRRPLFDDPETARDLFAVRQAWYAEVSTAEVNAAQPIETVANTVASYLK